LKKVIAIAIAFLNLFAFNMNSFLNKIKEQSNNTLKKYSSVDNFIKDEEKSVNYNLSLNLYRKYFPNDTYTINNYKKAFNPKYLFQRKTIIFYLFTTNMPSKDYLTVFKQAELIKNKLPLIGVLRGMDLKTKEKLDKAFEGTHIYFNGRVNPFIFRDLGIKEAPVFIIANCQVRPYLKYRSCKFLYRFDGDVSLSYALSKIGEYSNEIKKISMVFYK